MKKLTYTCLGFVIVFAFLSGCGSFGGQAEKAPAVPNESTAESAHTETFDSDCVSEIKGMAEEDPALGVWEHRGERNAFRVLIQKYQSDQNMIILQREAGDDATYIKSEIVWKLIDENENERHYRSVDSEYMSQDFYYIFETDVLSMGGYTFGRPAFGPEDFFGIPLLLLGEYSED